jgi:tetratricopeptide (TPR) repeat protein
MSEQLEAGKAHFRENRLREAEVCFRELITEGYELGDAYYGLGLIRMASDDSAEAWDYFILALDAEPAHIDAYLRLAQLARKAGDRRMAISLYGGVLVRDPDCRIASSAITELVSQQAATLVDSPVGRATDRVDASSTDDDAAEPLVGAHPAIARVPAPGRVLVKPEASSPIADRPPPDPPTSPGHGPRHAETSRPVRRRQPPYPPSSPNSLVGVISEITKGTAPWRGGFGSIELWRFRVRTYDDQGKPRRPIGFEMKGHDISGYIKKGDWVEIFDPPRPGKLGTPKRIQNLTDNTPVRAKFRWFTSYG